VVEQQPRLVYIHEKALFDTLLSAPERMTEAILALLMQCHSLSHFLISTPATRGGLGRGTEL
jgi:hypothetical protein